MAKVTFDGGTIAIFIDGTPFRFEDQTEAEPPINQPMMVLPDQLIQLVSDATRLLNARIQELEVDNDILHRRYRKLEAERQQVASSKMTCAECDSVLARW